ncbi:hypothetical protein ACFVIX_20860 [Bacillus subtilis]|uniref:hypothetical protein n=1 Tax=Bacillus subtilis TaxID=1423 RepID=UPI0011930B9C|nr:hypothetical protein [Bacillus subtilis]MBO3634423.1 hypothetical protein [Bacillus subtilis]MCY8983576.1 hypothetical protein [Bacillus subtilis]NJI50563.1 hypothetical protein [Bacillus subtilis]TVX87628.1 hypothetical protein FQP35_11720 [Bacillus subtilis]
MNVKETFTINLNSSVQETPCSECGRKMIDYFGTMCSDCFTKQAREARGPRVFIVKNAQGKIINEWYKNDIKSIEEEDGETIIRFYCGSWISTGVPALELKSRIGWEAAE